MSLINVLVVEDEGVVALDLQHQLIELGYSVSAVAATGEDAVRLVAETSPNIVLMDIRLAGRMDGISAAGEIRAQFDIPVVFLTAHADTDTLDRAKEAEPYGYLIKPFVRNELKPTIEIALARHNLRQQEQIYTQRLEQEIEERKRVEAALRASEQKSRGIIEQSMDGILLLDGEGCIVEWNPGMERLAGVDAADAIGQPLCAVMPVDQDGQELLGDLMRAEIQAALMMGHTSWMNETHECVCVDQDETRRMVEYKTFSVMAQGDTLIGAVVRDVTERKQTERQALRLVLEQERVRLLLNFITDVSHAFRTPLSVIGTRAFLLSKTVDEDKKGEHLAVIGQEIQSLTQLLEGLIILAQLDSGIGFDMNPVNLNLLLQPLMDRGTEEAGERDVQFTAELVKNMPLINGDSKRLAMAFMHILDNALRYTSPGGSVAVRAWTEDKHIVIEFEDTGVGMTEIESERAFERFFRGEKARASRGLGLGLAITKQIMELHQGSLEMTSTLGKGSCFRVTLPCAAGVNT